MATGWFPVKVVVGAIARGRLYERFKREFVWLFKAQDPQRQSPADSSEVTT